MELEQTIRDWGTPEWAIPSVAAWIRSGSGFAGDASRTGIALHRG